MKILELIILLRYGGIYERGSREYTLDDFYALQLDKLEKYLCLKESDVVIPDGDVESSSDDDDDDDDGNEDSDDDDDDDEEEDDGFDVEIEHDEADEEDTAEIAAKSREEDQQTAEIEKEANLVDEESKLSKVSSLPSTYSKCLTVFYLGRTSLSGNSFHGCIKRRHTFTGGYSKYSLTGRVISHVLRSFTLVLV
jgi:hypothetical protein